MHIKQGYPLWLHLATLDFAQRALQGAATPPLDPSNSTVSGCAQGATGNRLGRPPVPPIAVIPTVYDHPSTESPLAYVTGSGLRSETR